MGAIFTLPEVKFDWSKTITGKDRKLLKEKEEDTLQGQPAYWIFATILCALVATIFALRATEIIGLVCESGMNLLFLLAANVAAASLFFTPPKNLGLLVRRLTVIGMVVASFKRDMDWDLGKTLVSAKSAEEGGRYALRGKVVVVTGASSGVGLASAQLFSQFGATVVLGCRNAVRCEAAKRSIAAALRKKVTFVGPVEVGPPLDLSSLDSVWSFTEKVKAQYPSLDILVNNAGAVAEPGARTAQGFEELWGTMHLGHFALTEWLLPSLLKPLSTHDQEEEDEDFMPLHHSVDDPIDESDPGAAAASAAAATVSRDLRTMRGAGSSRVVWVASEAFLRGSFDESLMSGSGTGDLHGEGVDNCQTSAWGLPCCPIGACPHTNGYARAKLANVLTAYELQKRVDAHALSLPAAHRPRRLVSSSLHPGAVATNIHPVFSSRVTNWPMRSSLQAARLVIYAALEDYYIPGSYIDSMSRPHDLFGYFDSFEDDEGGEGISSHVAAWPTAKELPFYRAGVTEITQAQRTASNNANPAGAMYEGNFPKWVMTGKGLLHRTAPASMGGSFSAAMLLDPLQSLVLGVLDTVKETLLAASKSPLFTPVHFLWKHMQVYGASLGLCEGPAPSLIVPKSALEIANAAALEAQVTVSARLWEVTDSLVLAYETAVKAGKSTTDLESGLRGGGGGGAPQVSHSGLRLL